MAGRLPRTIVMLVSLGILVAGAWLELEQMQQMMLPADYRTFRTVTRKDPTRVRFLCTGDIRWNISVFEGIGKLAAKFDVDFVLLLGDVVKKANERSYQVFVSEMHEMRPGCPVFILPGNDEIDFDGGALFEKVVGARNFAVEAGDWTVLCLDNNNGLSEASWQVIRELISKRAGHVIIACHQPFSNNKEATTIAKQISVEAYFWGHLSKGFRKLQLAGKPAWEVPGGGAHLGPEKNPFAALVECDSLGVKVTKLDLPEYHPLWHAVEYQLVTAPPAVHWGMVALGAAGFLVAWARLRRKTRRQTEKTNLNL